MKCQAIKGINNTMSTDNELFDFWFTLVDENELEAVQKAQETVASSSESANATQDRLDKLFRPIQPLLNNLKRIPKKNIFCEA